MRERGESLEAVDGTETPLMLDRSKTVTMDRRTLLQGLAAGTVVALTGCADNAQLGRSQLLLISDAQLAEMSAGTWQQVQQQYKPKRDSAAGRRVDRIGQRIVDVSGMDTSRNWEFVVLDDPMVNAFVLPGGQVAFFDGIMGKFANDDQLATVMGHEVGHVAGRHGAERASQQLVAQIGLTVAQVALASTESQYAPVIAGVLGAGVTFGVILPYSRQHEYEADALGVRYMAKAGYRPEESIAFWQTMMGDGQKVAEFMSTHPSDSNRIAALRGEIQTLA
ncbi:MAG: M48 family metallopeptidase [Rhodospirillaceae bacterium]